MSSAFPIPHYRPFAHELPGAGLEGQYPVPLSSFTNLAYLGWNRQAPATNPQEAWNSEADPDDELALVADLAACAQASRLNTAVASKCEDDILRAAGVPGYQRLQVHSVRVAMAITLAGVLQSRPAHMFRDLSPARLQPGETDAQDQATAASAVLRATGPEVRAAGAAGATHVASTTYSDQARPWYVSAAQSAATAGITGYSVYRATRNPYLAVAAGASTILLDDETVRGIADLISGEFS